MVLVVLIDLVSERVSHIRAFEAGEEYFRLEPFQVVFEKGIFGIAPSM